MNRSKEMFRLSPAELGMLWGALARAQWTRPALFRQRVSAMGHSLRVTEAYVEATTAPGVVLSMVEDLVQEGRLSRTKATRIEDALLRSITAQGCWRGDRGAGPAHVGVLPPDVERVASLGQEDEKGVRYE